MLAKDSTSPESYSTRNPNAAPVGAKESKLDERYVLTPKGEQLLRDWKLAQINGVTLSTVQKYRELYDPKLRCPAKS
jgi:hypothetical protein